MRVASSSRTKRRAGAVALALVLALGTLVLAGGSPAGAANTAAEVLDEEKARPFAGASRYDTSAALAEAFLAERGSGTVILASGTSLVDALAASALAAVADAPILLTQRNDLPRVARTVISENDIFEVLIVGGESAVSAGVIEDIERIDDTIEITRLAGDTRYETAAAIAEEVDPGEYCDTSEAGAIIVNGGSIADAITAGPFAFAAELPVLLVETDSVPDSVADYIEEFEVGHVAIIGGTAVVSTETEEALRDLGVGVTRIAGATRHATAIAVANAMKNCEGLAVSSTHYALVNDGRDRNGAGFADGVAGAPVLGGEVFAEAGGTVPILLVGADELGAENVALLSSTPRRVTVGSDTVFVDIKFIAVGGTTAVTPEVVNEAIAAATTSPALTALLAGDAGASSFKVIFSEPVHTAGDCSVANNDGELERPQDDEGETVPYGEGSACNLGYYRVGGFALVQGDHLQIADDNRAVTITLGRQKLVVGDRLQVLASKVKAFTDDDNRRALAASTTLDGGPPDTKRPLVSVTAIHHAREIRITIEDSGVLTNGLALSDIEWEPTGLRDKDGNQVTFNLGDIALDLDDFDPPKEEPNKNDACDDADDDPVDDPAEDATNEPDLKVCLTQVTGKSGQAGIYKVEFQGPDATLPFRPSRNPTQAGDRFIVKSGAITDAGGRTSRSASATVTAVTVPSEGPPVKIRRAGVTSARAVGSDTPTPSDDANASAVFELLNGKELFTVRAKTGSSAEGARGNAWQFSLSSVVDAAEQGQAETTDVTVDFSSSRKSIVVTWDDEARVVDVMNAISGARGFDDLFTLTLHQEAVPIQSAAGIDGEADMPDVQELNVIAENPTPGGFFSAGGLSLSGGLHEVELEFVFDQYLKSFDMAAQGHAGERLRNANKESEWARNLYSWQLAFVGPSNTVRMVMEAESVGALPKRGNKFVLPAGAASLYPDFTGGLTYRGNAETTVTLRTLRS